MIPTAKIDTVCPSLACVFAQSVKVSKTPDGAEYGGVTANRRLSLFTNSRYCGGRILINVRDEMVEKPEF